MSMTKQMMKFVDIFLVQWRFGVIHLAFLLVLSQVNFLNNIMKFDSVVEFHIVDE